MKRMMMRRPIRLGLATAALLAFFALSVTSMAGKSPTMDEQGFLVRGLGYLRGQNQHMRVGHPLGLNAWNALLLRSASNVVLPLDDPSWQATSFHRPGELFLWEIGNDVEQVMWSARIMTIFLGMLLAAVVGRWAAEMSQRPWVGLFVLVLVAFDPNVLAHAQLTTTDLGLALGTAVAGYTLWRYLIQPTSRRALVAGIGFGLLANTKFTMGLFVPLFALAIGLAWLYHRRHTPTFTLKQPAQFVLVYPTAAFLTLWALYGFQIGTLPADLPALPQLGGLTLPLAHHIEQLLDIGNRAQTGASSFLLGDYRDTGWWYYFPVAFLVKTPLPTLLLLVGAAVTLLWHRRQLAPHAPLHLLILLIPPFGYLAIALTTTVNLGYRHLLPMWPFLWVLIGYALAQRKPTTHLSSGAIYLLPAWLIVSTLWLHPHYLAFFNPLAGGPQNGWRVLVDSNLDWGQDLAGLADWQRVNQADTLWLSYFGEARPDYYGLDYRGLDSFPPRYVLPGQNPLYPADPAPGLYAISATNLMGVPFVNKHQLAWFRTQEPIAKIGYTIFVYDVPPRGQTAALALPTGVEMTNLPAELFAPLATNDIQPRWYNTAASWLWPAAHGWLVLPANTDMPPLATADWVATADQLQLYRLSPPPAPPTPLADFGVAQLLAVEEHGEGELWTVWQATAADDGRPLNIFLHALDDEGNIIGQADVLDVAGWLAGDWFAQRHLFTAASPPAHYRIGLYDTATAEQLGPPLLLPADLALVRP